MATSKTKKVKKKITGSQKVGGQKVKPLGLREKYLAIKNHKQTISMLEKEIVKLSHSGTTQQLYEKRQEVQWCRNSLEAAELEFSELASTFMGNYCELGLELAKNPRGYEFGFTGLLEGKGKTPEEAVAKFNELLG